MDNKVIKINAQFEKSARDSLIDTKSIDWELNQHQINRLINARLIASHQIITSIDQLDPNVTSFCESNVVRESNQGSVAGKQVGITSISIIPRN
jgi:hypothetical protein